MLQTGNSEREKKY